MAANKRIKNLNPNRATSRAASDGFYCSLKQAKSSFSQMWQRPIGNLLTLAQVFYGLGYACLFISIR